MMNSLRLGGKSRSRRLTDYALLLLTVGLGGYTVLSLRQPWAKAPTGAWLWLLLIAVGLLGGYALLRMDQWLLSDLALRSNEPAIAPPGRARQLRWAAWLLALAIGLTLWVVWRLWPDYRKWDGTVAPWLAALVLVVAAGALMGKIGRPSSLTTSKPAGQIPLWLEITGFLLIAGLAVFLRVYHLSSIPAGIYVDETNGALDAVYILEGRNSSPFGTGWYGTPNGYVYYMAGLFKLFGVNFASLKIASLLPAILTVLALYPLARFLFGPMAGLSAMLLMAVSRWHLSMSRWGWNEVAPPLFQILATFFLVRGLRERRASDFVLGGVISGLMMYTYLSSRLALATLGLFVLYWLLADLEGPVASWKREWRGLVLFLLAFLIAFAPIAVTHITDPFTWSNRVDQISIFRDVKDAGSYQPLWKNISDHLKFFHQTGDHQGKHNLPDEPQTDPVTGLLFVIGLGYGLLRFPRDRRRGLLWFWLLFGLAGGVFSSNHESPQSYRTLTVVPAIALLAGDVLARLARGSIALVPAISDPKRLARYRTLATGFGGLLLVGSLSASAAWESSTYFGRQAKSIAVQAGFNLTENQIAQEVLKALDSDTPVYLSPRFYDFSPLRFLVYGAVKYKTGRNTLDDRPWHLARPEQDLPAPDVGRDAIFLLDTYYQPVMDYFRSFYPQAQIETVRWRDEIPLYLRVRVPHSELAALQGLEARFVGADGKLIERVASQIDEDWSQQAVTSAEWSGNLKLEHSGMYDFTPQGNLTVTVDGQPWNGSRFLCSGLHDLRVTQSDTIGGANRLQGVARLNWTMPNGTEEIIPAQALFHVQVPAQGLTGYYYAGEKWQGEPLCRTLTPFFLLAWPDQEPVQGPFSAHFVGALRITQAGNYHFWVNADDGARLTLDGTVLGEGLTPDQPNNFEASLDLEPGDHPIQIDYFQQGGGSALEFYWQPPDGNQTPVPPGALVPETP